MRRTYLYRIWCLVFAAAIMVGSVPSALAAETEGRALTKVSLPGNGSVTISDVASVPNGNVQTVAFMAKWKSGSQTIALKDYLLRVITKGGTEVEASLRPNGSRTDKMPAGSEQSLQYYVELPASVQLADIRIEVVNWDFDVSGYQRVLGTAAIPSGYTATAAAGTPAAASAAGHPFAASVAKSVMSVRDDDLQVEIELNVTNAGNTSAQVPDGKFAVRTKDGTMYDLDAAVSLAGLLQPNKTATYALTGELPASVPTDGWQLLWTEQAAVGERDVELPVASFELEMTKEQPGTLGARFDYVKDGDTYAIRVDSIYRSPWGEEDILAAHVTVSNPGTSALDLVDLSAYAMLDGKIRVDMEAVQADVRIGLQAGQSVSYSLVGKIPYTSEFSEIDLMLRDADKDIRSIAYAGELTAVPVVEEGGSFIVAGVGRQAEVSVEAVDLYAGRNSDIFAVRLGVTNREQRYKEVPELTYHLRSADGTMYPTTVRKTADKTRPNGTQLVTVWTVLDKETDTSGMQLLIGESVTGNAFTAVGGVADAIVNPAWLSLPDHSADAAGDWRDLEVGAYRLTIDQLRGPSLYYNQNEGMYEYTISFDYELTRDLLVQTDSADATYVVELEDGFGNVLISETFGVDQGGARNNGTSFELGTGYMELTQAAESFSLSQAQYTINVYDEIEPGYKRLLASKTMDH